MAKIKVKSEDPFVIHDPQENGAKANISKDFLTEESDITKELAKAEKRKIKTNESKRSKSNRHN